jgi:hypothetical protein
MLLAAMLAWRDCEQCNVIAFLREENRVFKAQLGRRRLRLDDRQRRRLAMLGDRLGRSLLREYATLAHRTRFFGGIGSWWCRSGRTHGSAQGDRACRTPFDGSSCEWRLTIRSGDTRGFKVR